MKSSDFGFIKCSSCGCDIGWINGWEIKYREDWPKGLQDYRIIFWFDN